MITQVQPNFDDSESKDIAKYFESDGWLTENKITKTFEEQISKFQGREFAIATTSGTIALYLAILALKLNPGSNIVVPNLTMVATINVIKWAGHNPVIVDTDEELCLNLTKLIELKNIHAVMFVPLNGKGGKGIEVMNFCNENNIPLIEDSAHALGSNYSDSLKCGSLGDLSILSFTPHKIITTGQGGMVLTNNEKYNEFIYNFKSFYREKDKSDYHEQLGLNFKFTDIQATVGLTQFNKLNKFITRKNQIQKRYLENIQNEKFKVVEFKNHELPWFHTLEFKNPKHLSNVQKKLYDNKVETRTFYPPLSEQKYLKNSSKTDLTSSSDTLNRFLWLPSSTKLIDKDIDYISDLLNDI
ncbi:MAG: hypothetical protein CBD76_00480 [Pelagibacteraceae bacterium TMED216]|nr:MAG: hypothetical protein CBD76_00480 [Pelagibacteraceae bacterium TMED216]